MASTPIPHLRLLSLDGGGVRGLASLIVLKKLLATVGNPKPCEFFDMICGTSTGGLIAIMLGILEMNIDECIQAFSEMMAKVFVHKRVLPFSMTGKVKGRYSTAPLEKCIEEVLSNHGKSGFKMRHDPNPSCKVFVLAMEKDTAAAVYFKNYVYLGDGPLHENITILDAALATTAATTFFSDKAITTYGKSQRIFCDAALGENNPVRALYTEAILQYGSESEIEPQIRCLLSIGTGKPPINGLGNDVKSKLTAILEIAKETTATARSFKESHPRLDNRGAYYRFTPSDIYDIRIDDADMGGRIEAITELYMRDEANIVAQFARHNGPTNSTTEMKTEETPQARPQPPTRLFHTLSGNAKYLCHPATYWRHLTLGGYEKYLAIYENCKPNKRFVGYPTFQEQFRKYRGDGYDPPSFKIEQVWQRVMREGHIAGVDVQTSTLQKDLVMATIYMLHVETSVHTRHERPEKRNGQPGIDSNRREVLKRFSKWVPCRYSMECGKEWNFVNDVGLSRPEGHDRRCKIVEMLVGGAVSSVMLSSKSFNLLEVMKSDWYKSTL